MIILPSILFVTANVCENHLATHSSIPFLVTLTSKCARFSEVFIGPSQALKAIRDAKTSQVSMKISF